MSLRVAPRVKLHRGNRAYPFMANVPPAVVAAVAAGQPSAGDVKAVIDSLQAAFATFKQENDTRLAAIAANRGDVVQTEKVEKIGADVIALQGLVTTLNATLDAQRMGIGGPAGNRVKPEVAAHTAAFDTWFRRGDVPGNMRQLEVQAALSTDSNPDGGYLVPETVEQEITRVVGTRSAMRQVARIMPISTANYKKPHNLGGATAGWIGEKTAPTNTNTPQLAELDFPTMELYAQPAATNQILEDSRVDMGAWLGEELSITFAEQEGAAFVTGDANKKPAGVAGTFYTKVANASYAWGKIGYIVSGVAAALTDSTHNGYDAMKGIVFGLKSAYRSNANWMMNDLTQLAISVIKDDNENYIWQPSVQVGEPSMLLGYPIVPDDNFADIGANSYPIAFGDFKRGYLIVDRLGTTILRDPFTQKPYVLFYTRKRVGGGIQDFAAIKLLKISA